MIFMEHFGNQTLGNPQSTTTWEDQNNSSEPEESHRWHVASNVVTLPVGGLFVGETIEEWLSGSTAVCFSRLKRSQLGNPEREVVTVNIQMPQTEEIYVYMGGS